MKKFLTTTTTILATLLLLSTTSCISEPILPPINGERTVALQIVDTPDPRGTRNTAPIPSGTPLVFNTGHIYLVSSDGIIARHFTVVAADAGVTSLTPENLENRIIHRNLLDAGVMLLNMPGNVAEVVIVGNTPNSNHTGDVDGDLIGGRLLNIITQHNAENVNLFGRRALPPTPVTNSEGLTYFPVSVHLSPTVARFELPSITGSGMITGFTVEGVFINHYHRQATIAGAIPNINNEPNLITHTDAASFVYNAPGTSYTSASNNALFYWNATANAGAGFYQDGLTVRPSDEETLVFHPNVGSGTNIMRDHVWGFQLFARNYGETTTPETEAPSLVIRLSNITLSDGRTINEPRFITVGGLYRRQNNNLVRVTHIRAANVYHVLDGILFDETDLGEVPGENEINVVVTVTLAVWDSEDVHQRFRQPSPVPTLQISYGAGGTLTLGAARPSDGVTYQWQISTDNGVTWTDIEGATGLNHTIPPATLNAPALFRRAATLGDETIVTNPIRVYDALAERMLASGVVNLENRQPARFTTANVSFYMMPVTGGLFWRGTSAEGSGSFQSDPDRMAEREDNMHVVGVNSFHIAQTPVTRALYTMVMTFNGTVNGVVLTPVTFQPFTFPSGQNNSQLVANNISWYDAVVFMNRLSVIFGLEPVFELVNPSGNLLNTTRPTGAGASWGNRVRMNLNANGFRFPSEAEWEYAARGGQRNEYTRTLGSSGTQLRWSGSNNATAVAWHNANSGNATRAVGGLAPNELGIYDMSGNVWEWCWDWAVWPYPGSVTRDNPWGADTGLGRVMRGGSWHRAATYARVARRGEHDAWYHDAAVGLRVVLPAMAADAKQGGETDVIAIENITILDSAGDDIAGGVRPLHVGESQPFTFAIMPDNATIQYVTWLSSDPAVATVSDDGVVTGVSAGTAVIRVTTVCLCSKYAYVTVTVSEGALIGGVRWAVRNVYYPNTFAAYPHSSGRFFQWGTLNGNTHHWPATGDVFGWNSSADRDPWTVDNQPCPVGWRLPTLEEVAVLHNDGGRWYDNWNGTGIPGRVFPDGVTPEQVTGTAPTAIFLPAIGLRSTYDGVLNHVGEWGRIWSSTPSTATTAHRLNFNATNTIATSRSFGYSIRCVRDI